jgi:hypothetical protein
MTGDRARMEAEGDNTLGAAHRTYKEEDNTPALFALLPFQTSLVC